MSQTKQLELPFEICAECGEPITEGIAHYAGKTWHTIPCFEDFLDAWAKYIQMSGQERGIIMPTRPPGWTAIRPGKTVH